jgi:DMSO/TMAO reductase YedYZ molybdopterin-dependent catalytic subunit
VPLESYRLVIGASCESLYLSYNDVIDRQSYRKFVRLNCVEGWSVDILWEGVRLVDLLNEAGYDPTAKIVIFRCYDGYSTSLPLSKIVDQNLLLAYRMNGVDLPEERGFPFQLIAEDQWGYKWAKWITEIEVSNDTGFQGYWETRGYDNDATLPELRNQSAPATTP